jgi:hypothetical protein
MTQDAATPPDTDPHSDTSEKHPGIDKLRSFFRGHRADPADPEHACRCGWKGESYDEHLARETFTELQIGGYDFWPSRHA